MTPPSLHVPSSTLPAWLAGAWSIERDIDGGRGSFTGTATFTPQSDGTVRWEEHGTLRLDDFAGPVKRVLFLHAAEPWEVRFDDGRPFHPLDLSAGRCAVDHPCGPDHYRGSYDPISDDAFVVDWVVTGPGREDHIVSRYQRQRSMI